MLVPASRAHSLVADHAGRPVKERAFPKNLRPRPNCCDNAAGGPRARPRVIERNETRIALSQVKHVFLVCSALVLLALTPPPSAAAAISVKSAGATSCRAGALSVLASGQPVRARSARTSEVPGSGLTAG